MQIPELLAPAGSIETLRAAFEAGADAFYLGYGDFNARKRAKNFTEEELRLAAEFVHHHGRRIYLTLNTLVFDRELNALLELLELVREIRADAVIVQDWGVVSLLREYFPEIPVHASTQMFCHNSLHAEFLRDRGIRRIILPRELSTEEIGTMMERVPLEYEVFVHGAMCFSFSGCCLASSWLHGDSGNRGQCRQVCRFPFRGKGGERYPFSMKDMNALEYVGELARMGVSSLKIEGRLKNAAYVAETVSAYRAVLDAVRDGRSLPAPPRLSRQRETDSGYFRENAGYSRLVSPESTGTAGEVFGEALSVMGKEIRIVAVAKPARGMRLRVQDARGRNIHEGVLLDFTRERMAGRDVLVWMAPKTLGTSGFVPPYTVYSTGMSAPSDAGSFLKNRVKKLTVASLFLKVHIREGAVSIRAVDGAEEGVFEREYPLMTEVSRSRPLDKDECARIFSQTDTLPYSIATADCRVDSGLFCPLGELKEVRRAFYRDFDSWYAAAKIRARAIRRSRLAAQREEIKGKNRTTGELRTLVYPDIPTPLREEREPDSIVYPVELESGPEVKPSARTILLLPHFVSERLAEEWKERLRELVHRGYTRFLAPTFGWLSLREELPEAEFIAGPYFYAVNSLAVDFLERNGVRAFVLSPDIHEEDADPVSRYCGRIIPLNAPREMFITRLRVPEGEYRLKDRVFRPRFFREYTVVEEKPAP